MCYNLISTNRKRKMQTRKYPRTLNEAFGPYCSNKIEEPKRAFDWQDKVVMIGSVITGVICLALVFLGL